MHNQIPMTVSHGLACLSENVAGALLRESFATADVGEQVAPTAQVHHEDNTVFSFIRVK